MGSSLESDPRSGEFSLQGIRRVGVDTRPSIWTFGSRQKGQKPNTFPASACINWGTGRRDSKGLMYPDSPSHHSSIQTAKHLIPTSQQMDIRKLVSLRHKAWDPNP